MSMVVYLRRSSPDEVARLEQNPDAVDDLFFGDDFSVKSVNFDKAWHALHFMLTGNSGSVDAPLNLLVASDAELRGTDELGLGGYWLADPDRVQRFASALSELSDETIASRYDPVTLKAEHVYLSDVFEDEGTKVLPYVLQAMPALRSLADEALRNGDYIIGVLR